MKKIHSAWVAFGAVVLVAGCGGGGSSTGDSTIPTGAVQITATNAPAVAKGAATPSQDMAMGAGGKAGVIGVVAPSTGRSRSVLDLSLAKFAQVRGIQLAPTAGVVGVIAGYPVDIHALLAALLQ